MVFQNREQKKQRKIYSLLKVARESGIAFAELKHQIKGRRYVESSLSREGDIAVSAAQLRLMPSLAGRDFGELLRAGEWDEAVGEREVVVMQKPPNSRLLLCYDKAGLRYHVWVGSNRAFFKGMRLMIAPHPASSMRGFWHVIGPVPRYPGDKSFELRWREWKKLAQRG